MDTNNKVTPFKRDVRAKEAVNLDCFGELS